MSLILLAALAVTQPTIDPLTYSVGADPRSVLMTFANGADTRGFAWETDTTVSGSRLWILPGEYSASDGAVFDAVTPIEGSYVDRVQSGKTVRCHKVQVTNLATGQKYSYRLGDANHYAFGQFTVRETVGRAVTMLTLSDAQVMYTPSFYVWENTVARAVAIVPPSTVDCILFGGDMFDDYATSISAYNYLKWGATVDSALLYYPNVPWSLSSGNHDLDKNGYQYYRELTGVNYSDEQCHSFNYGKVHVVVLPFLKGEKAANFTEVASWTDADIGAANAAGETTWTVMMIHWGPYTTGDHGYRTPTSELVELFCPIFSRRHVDLVLQAHDHTYSKTLPYRWDANGYAQSRTDGAIINLAPATTFIGGVAYDLNPQGTYYVCTGCSGPRVYEGNGAYAFIGGSCSYENRKYKVATGKIALDSVYAKSGDDASSELREAMFGVLKADDETLTYDWYAVATNGLSDAVHYDTLRICKRETYAAEVVSSSGKKRYSTLSAALAAATSGETVRLGADNADASLSTAADAIDLNGFKAGATAVTFAGGGAKLLCGGEMSSYASRVSITVTGDLTVDGLTFHQQVDVSGSGDLLVTGCEFKNDLATDGTEDVSTAEQSKTYYSFNLAVGKNFERTTISSNVFHQARRCCLQLANLKGVCFIDGNLFLGDKQCLTTSEFLEGRKFGAMQIFGQEAPIYIERNTFRGAWIAETFVMYNEEGTIITDQPVVFNSNSVEATVPYLWYDYLSDEGGGPTTIVTPRVFWHGLDCVDAGVDRTRGQYKAKISLNPAQVAVENNIALPAHTPTFRAFEAPYYVNDRPVENLSGIRSGDYVLSFVDVVPAQEGFRFVAVEEAGFTMVNKFKAESTSPKASNGLVFTVR